MCQDTLRTGVFRSRAQGDKKVVKADSLVQPLPRLVQGVETNTES